MEQITVKSKVYDGRYIEAVCRQIPNVEENTSEIRWTLTVAGGESSWYSTGPTTLTIGEQEVFYCKRKSYTTKTFPAARGSVSGTLTVAHDENGNCSLPVRLKTAIYTQTLSETADTWELDTIQRASEIRASDGSIGSCVTVVIGRRSGDFTHTVSYQFGSLSGWLDALGDPVTAPVQHGETTLSFRLPEAFYNEIPDAPRGSCLLTCTTYYGETCIGQRSGSFTVTADPALCGPQVEGVVSPVDPLTLGLTDGTLIPGISTACCQVTAAARKGASLVSVTAGEVAVENGEALLPGWALPTVPVVVTDSRGYVTRTELPSPCLAYVQLADVSEVARPEPTADCAILTLQGRAFSGSFGAVDNALTATVDFDGRQMILPVELAEDGSYLQMVELEDLRYTHSYPVTVTVADRAMSVVRQLTVRKGLPVFDWGEGDFRFHVPVELPALTVGGISLANYISSVIKE